MEQEPQLISGKRKHNAFRFCFRTWSGSGFESGAGSNIKWNTKVKSQILKNEMTTFWETILLLKLERQKNSKKILTAYYCMVWIRSQCQNLVQTNKNKADLKVPQLSMQTLYFLTPKPYLFTFCHLVKLDPTDFLTPSRSTPKKLLIFGHWSCRSSFFTPRNPNACCQYRNVLSLGTSIYRKVQVRFRIQIRKRFL